MSRTTFVVQHPLWSIAAARTATAAIHAHSAYIDLPENDLPKTDLPEVALPGENMFTSPPFVERVLQPDRRPSLHNSPVILNV